MSTFELILRTPEQTFFDDRVQMLTVLQSDGYRTFLAHHEGCLGDIKEGVCTFRTDSGDERHFVTSGGFFTVSKDKVTVNSSIIAFGDDYDLVLEQFSLSSAELRARYVQARQEYTKSKMELAKSLTGKKEES